MLSAKLEASEKRVNKLLSERAVMRSCIIDVTSMLSDIVETRDSLLTITVCKHLLEKVRPAFAMLHRLEGVPELGFILKQGGESASRKEETKAPVKPVAPVKSVVKQ